MSSLQAHLERHDLGVSALAFRRDCPLCGAERVHGQLPSPSVVPPRARAAMVAAMLGAGSVAPAAAGAADGQAVAAPAPASPPPPAVVDVSVSDGGAAPVQAAQDSGRGRGSQSPAGASRSGDGGSTATGSNTGGSRQAARQTSTPAGRPPDHGPANRADVASRDPGRAPNRADTAPTVRANASADARLGAPPRAERDDVPAPSSHRPVPIAGGATPVPSAAPASAGAGRRPSSAAHRREARASSRRSSPVAEGRGPGAHDGTAATRGSSGGAGRTQRDGRVLVAEARSTRSPAASEEETDKPATYRVRPGDSLWRIADRRLGPGATDAATAREVTRLWELNRERIGTGNPDLIFPGQTLRM